MESLTINFIQGDLSMDILELIKLLQGATNVTVNINTAVPTAEGNAVEAEEEVSTSDFDIGETVIIKHTRLDGTVVNTTGVVTEFGADALDSYVRALGANGKHYRAGIHNGEERLGTIFHKIDS